MHTKSVFKIPGELSRSIDDVDRMLAAGNVELTLDFDECKFITVDGLEWLEELLLRATSLSSAITLVNVPPSIYKVFKISRIDAVLKACGSPSHTAPVC